MKINKRENETIEKNQWNENGEHQESWKLLAMLIR